MLGKAQDWVVACGRWDGIFQVKQDRGHRAKKEKQMQIYELLF